MENNKKHVPNMEISNFGGRSITDYTYHGGKDETTENQLNAYFRDYSDNRLKSKDGGTDDGNSKTNQQH
jgi:hypothetical protein